MKTRTKVAECEAACSGERVSSHPGTVEGEEHRKTKTKERPRGTRRDKEGERGTKRGEERGDRVSPDGLLTKNCSGAWIKAHRLLSCMELAAARVN